MKAGIEIAGRTITSLVERKNAEAVKAISLLMGVTLHDLAPSEKIDLSSEMLLH